MGELFDALLNVLVVISVFVMIGAFISLGRNNLVYRVRTNILRRSRYDGHNFIGHDSLPSYERMIWQLDKWSLKDWEKDLPAGWEDSGRE